MIPEDGLTGVCVGAGWGPTFLVRGNLSMIGFFTVMCFRAGIVEFLCEQDMCLDESGWVRVGSMKMLDRSKTMMYSDRSECERLGWIMMLILGDWYA